MRKKQKNHFLLFDTYIVSIKKSVGVKLFQNIYVLADGKKKDVTQNGKNSCASFASSILVMYGLIKEKHATVDGTLKDMEKSGWTRLKKAKIGAVMVWKPWEKSKNQHIGFFIGNDRAISNSSDKKTPKLHHLTYGAYKGRPKRPIDSVWWHKSLGK